MHRLTHAATVLQIGGGASASEFIGSIVILATLAILVAIGYSRLKYTNLSDQHTSTKQDARQQWFEQTPATVFFREGESQDTIESEFEAGLEAAEQGTVSSAQPDGTVTVPAAIVDAWHDLQADLSRRLEGVPRIIPALGLVAMFVFVFGTAAVYTDAIVTALTTTDASTPDLLAFLRAMWNVTTSVLGTIGSLLGLVPFGDVIVSLALTLGITGGTWLYSHYYLVGLALVIVAAVIGVLDRRVPHDDVDTSLYYYRSDIILATTGALVAIWVAGVVPTVTGNVLGRTAIGSTLRLEAVGRLIGALAPLVVAGYFVLIAIRSVRRRLAVAATIDWEDGPDRLLGAYLVARYTAVGLIALATPLVAAFIVVLLVGGRLFAILDALGAAPWPVQLAVVLATIGAVVITGYEAKERWPELARAARKALASQSVRLLIFRKAITAVAIVAGATLAWAIAGIMVAIWAGLLAGIVVYGLYSLSLRARYRSDMFSFSLPTRRATVARCGYMELEGYDQYVIDIGGEKYAHTSRADCARDAAAVAWATVNGDDKPATEADHYGEALFRYGYADPDDQDEKLDEKVRKAGLRRPREEQQLALESLEDDLEDEYPEERAEEWIERFLNLEVLYPRGDGYVEYRPENDPWRQRRRRS